MILTFLKSLFISRGAKKQEKLDKNSNTYVSDILNRALKVENSCDLYISDRVVEFIKTFEGFSSSVYLCPAGKKTIGFGHVVNDASDVTITESSAEFLLRSDLFKIRRRIIRDLEDAKITQGQFEALVSLSYNAGDLKTVAKKGWTALMKNDLDTAATEFFSEEKGIVHVGKKKLQGLVNRRKAELTQLWEK